jgi:hypothetical protein
VESIEPVIARMDAIARELPESDGVARFNALYLAVTREVAAQARSGTFEDPDALSLLDVVFADLYFAAFDAARRRRKVPRAWRPLFEARRKHRVAPIQFALAGMNTHINHDLVLAIVETCRRRRIKVERGSAFHRDYLAVNRLLERVEERVKPGLLPPDLAKADAALGRLDDVLAMWKVARARDAAWSGAETVTRLPRAAREPYLDALAGTVGFAGRGLLVPVL